MRIFDNCAKGQDIVYISHHSIEWQKRERMGTEKNENNKKSSIPKLNMSKFWIFVRLKCWRRWTDVWEFDRKTSYLKQIWYVNNLWSIQKLYFPSWASHHGKQQRTKEMRNVKKIKIEKLSPLAAMVHKPPPRRRHFFHCFPFFSVFFPNNNTKKFLRDIHEKWIYIIRFDFDKSWLNFRFCRVLKEVKQCKSKLNWKFHDSFHRLMFVVSAFCFSFSHYNFT